MVAASTGSAAFLFPAARTEPLNGRPPSITNDSMAREWYSLGPVKTRSAVSWRDGQCEASGSDCQA